MGSHPRRGKILLCLPRIRPLGRELRTSKELVSATPYIYRFAYHGAQFPFPFNFSEQGSCWRCRRGRMHRREERAEQKGRRGGVSYRVPAVSPVARVEKIFDPSRDGGQRSLEGLARGKLRTKGLTRTWPGVEAQRNNEVVRVGEGV